MTVAKTRDDDVLVVSIFGICLRNYLQLAIIREYIVFLFSVVYGLAEKGGNPCQLLHSKQ